MTAPRSTVDPNGTQTGISWMIWCVLSKRKFITYACMHGHGQSMVPIMIIESKDIYPDSRPWQHGSKGPWNWGSNTGLPTASVSYVQRSHQFSSWLRPPKLPSDPPVQERLLLMFCDMKKKILISWIKFDSYMFSLIFGAIVVYIANVNVPLHSYQFL